MSKKKQPPFYSLQVNQPNPSLTSSKEGKNILPSSGLILEATVSAGPLPSPEVIAGYERVLTGSADRIIRMAEKEQDHRHQLQIEAQRLTSRVIFIGQFSAFILGISGIAGGIYLVNNDKSLAGFGIFFTSLTALIGLFFYNQNRRKNTPAAKEQ